MEHHPSEPRATAADAPPTVFALLRSGFRPLALTVVSSQLFGLAFPPHRIRILAWIALVPFFVALQGIGRRHVLLLAWVWSVLAAWSVGQWMPRAIETYYLQTKLVGWAFFFGIATLMAAPYYAAFALCARRLWSGSRTLLPALLAAAWTAAELARGRLFTGLPFFIGNPWALLGYSQIGWLPVTQIADLGGVYSISFVVACFNAAIASAYVAWRTRRLNRRLLAVYLTTALCPAALGLAYGGMRLSEDLDTSHAAASVPIALIQGDVSLGSRWRADFYGRDLDTYLRLTIEALQRTHPAIVFWPESSMTFFLEAEPTYRAAMRRVLEPFGAELVAGAPRATSREGPPYFNSIYVMASNGDLRARYDKEYLVPFGEYFPFGSIELLRRRFGPAREFFAGAGGGVLPTAAGPAGILTCNEAMLPEVAAERVAAGAVYLVNPSNDTWIPDEKFADLQFDIVSLRAIEQRRTLLRVSTSGPSAIVDPYGNVHGRTEAFRREVVLGTLRPRGGATAYARIGDTFAVLCGAAALWGCGGRRRRHDR